MTARNSNPLADLIEQVQAIEKVWQDHLGRMATRNHFFLGLKQKLGI